MAISIAIITAAFVVNKPGDHNTDKGHPIKDVPEYNGDYVSVSSYKENGDPLFDTSKIKVDNNSKASLKIVLENGIDYSRDYKVIVLQNFVQTDFYVDNEKSKDKTYLFNVEARKEISLSISADINEDTKELAILIIKEPDDIVTELDFNKLEYYEEVYAKRFLVDNKAVIPKHIYIKPDFKYKSEVDDTPIFLSNVKDTRTVVPSVEEGSKAYLHMGNPLLNTEIIYAVIAMQDWNQVSINEDLVMYTNVPSDKTIGYEVNLPFTGSQKTNLQFVAFPYPYDKWSEQYFKQVEYTFRTVIIPK